MTIYILIFNCKKYNIKDDQENICICERLIQNYSQNPCLRKRA